MSSARDFGEADGALRVRGGVELHFNRTEGREFRPHFHEEYQIVLVVDGGLALEIDGVEHEARRGDVCVIAPEQVHAARPLDWGWACRIFYAPPALVDGIAAEFGLNAPYFATPVFADAAVADSLAAAYDGSDADIEDLRQAFALLLLEHASPSPPRVAPVMTCAAEAHIRAHFAERVELAELAALCGYSRHHFLRVFAREWGLTPGAYQAQVRVAHAMRLLRRGASAAVVAQEAGYFDQSHLIRALRRSHALTPGLVQRAH